MPAMDSPTSTLTLEAEKTAARYASLRPRLLVLMVARAAAPSPLTALIRIDEHADSSACGGVALAEQAAAVRRRAHVVHRYSIDAR
jgi:hypothetical protein